jgi:chromosome segregation ATPase
MNTYTIKSNDTVINTTTNLPKAIDLARVFCKDEANAGREIIIFKGEENVFHAVSVKHSTGKMVMMMKNKYNQAMKKRAAAEAKYQEYTDGVAKRKEERKQKKLAAEKTAQKKAELKENNAKIREIYAKIHEVHTEYSKKKHSFLKAFRTLQAKEREEVNQLKAELENLYAEKSGCKASIIEIDINACDVNENVENIF